MVSARPEGKTQVSVEHAQHGKADEPESTQEDTRGNHSREELAG